MKNQHSHFSSPHGQNFYVVGLSYIKADAETRGHFSLSEVAQEHLLLDAKSKGYRAFCVISTCNRTELYGFAESPNDIIKLLCHHTVGSVAEFLQVGYIYEKQDAVSHLFNVGTGLDSQIIGDFEIISQLRNRFRASKNIGLLDAFMERLINAVIQASKRIKNETEISSGATSVSFAAVQYIMARVPYVSEKNILLFGIGKIGRNTCENLIKHTRNEHITLINRTKIKAAEIAGKFNLLVKDYIDIQSEIARTDVLVVATGAQQPTINKELLFLTKPLLILDLSIPKNVAIDVVENPLVTLVHLDELSQMTNQTLHKRKEQLPEARRIIAEVRDEFNTWASHRQFAPTITALKNKLTSYKIGEIDFQKKRLDGFNEEQAEIIASRLIQKITTQVASHLKNANGTTQESIELLKQLFELENRE